MQRTFNVSLVSSVRPLPRYNGRSASSRRRPQFMKTINATTDAISSGQLDFVAEMREHSMRLHKAPPKTEGQKEAPPPFEQWVYTVEGFLQFLVESKRVYAEFEKIIQSNDTLRSFREAEIHRTQSVEQDIAWISNEYGLTVPELAKDGPAETYAKLLRELAKTNVYGFISHFYNFYLAHTAGGRMIGRKVADSVLNGEFDRLAFYKYDSDVKDVVAEFKEGINLLTVDWTREQKEVALEEIPEAFKSAGSVLRTLFISDK